MVRWWKHKSYIYPSDVQEWKRESK
uniref:Uncharacterized protein n=1 Tax=Anopheles albimanus TaxID=7167 RepID=A0A182FY27_ANOAL